MHNWKTQSGYYDLTLYGNMYHEWMRCQVGGPAWLLICCFYVSVFLFCFCLFVFLFLKVWNMFHINLSWMRWKDVCLITLHKESFLQVPKTEWLSWVKFSDSSIIAYGNPRDHTFLLEIKRWDFLFCPSLMVSYWMDIQHTNTSLICIIFIMWLNLSLTLAP